MSSTNKPQPPRWAPHAVATTVGWVDPKRNEVLVSLKGLPDALPFINGKIIYPEQTEKPKEQEEITKTSVETTEKTTKTTKTVKRKKSE